MQADNTLATIEPWRDEEPEPNANSEPVPESWDENPKRRGGRKRRLFNKGNRKAKVTGITTPLKNKLDLIMPVMVPEKPDGLVCVLKSAQYVVSGSIGPTVRSMFAACITLDTGAGPCLIRPGCLPKDWRENEEPGEELPALGDANGKRLKVTGAVRLRVRFGSHVYRQLFYVTPNLAVPALLGTEFLNRHVRAILCMEQKVQFNNGPTVSIISSGTGDDPVQLEGKQFEPAPVGEENEVEEEEQLSASAANILKRHKVKTTKAVRLPAYSQTWVPVSSEAAGLVYLEPKFKLTATCRIATANGIIEMEPGKTTKILVSNFSSKKVNLYKGTTVAFATRSPIAINELPTEQGRELAHKILAIPSEAILTDTDARREVSKDGELEPVVTANPPDPPPQPPEMVDEEDWRSKVKLDHLEDKSLVPHIMAMLSKHSPMWQKGKLGKIDATEHRIELLPGTKPIRQAPYRQGPHKRKETEKAINEMLEAGVIEPANCEWASPVVLAPKPDGTWRFCVDYRKLNAATIADSYPLPRADDCLDSLGTAMVFTTLDCNSGYWQLALAEEDKDKTAFVSHMGTHRYNRMPFGLRNAPASFQRALDIILSGVRWQTCLIYLDDVIVFSQSHEQHVKDVDEVLTLLEKAGVSLKLSKCEFFQPRVNYLGHVIMPGKLAIAKERTSGFANATFPKDKSTMRSFMGAANYYRRFIKDFSGVARPLNDMLKKGEPATFGEPTEEQLEAFEHIKDALVNPPVLVMPRHDKNIMVDTDASAYQLGVVLLQQQDPEDDKSWKPVGYYSKSLNKSERNYSATERECFAVVWACLALRPYLEGRRFVIRTDHDALKWLLTLDDPSGRLARWRLRLAEFNIRIEYRPGRVHQVPDALSRVPHTEDHNHIPVDDEIPGIEDFILAIRDANEDPDANTDWASVKPLDVPLSDKDQESLPEDSREWPSSERLVCPDHKTHFGMEMDDLFVDELPIEQQAPKSPSYDNLPSPISLDEILLEQQTDAFCQNIAARLDEKSTYFHDGQGILRRRLPADKRLTQIVLPLTLRPRALILMHHSPMAGHPGQTRMYANMRRVFYWPQMAADIFGTVRRCYSCARERLRQRKRFEPLQLFPPERPLEDVAIDVLGPLPETKNGYKYVLVITDRFSKLTQAVPLKNVDAYTCAVQFVQHWIFKYGPPARLLSDNGTNFLAKFFQEVCRTLGTANVFTTAYHPETNGQAERYNRTLLNMLRHYVGDHQDDWDRYTGPLSMAYNMSVHSSTGTTPFELVLSRPPPPFVLDHSSKVKRHITPLSDQAEEAERKAGKVKDKEAFLTSLQDLVAKAGDRLTASQLRYKETFDRKAQRKLPQLKSGQYVWLDPKQRTGSVNKLQPSGDGPYRILDVGKGTLVIKRGNEIERVNRARVELAPGPPENEKRAAWEPTAKDFQEKTRGPEWVVDRVLDHHIDDDGAYSFHVRWYGPYDDSWQPRSDLNEETVARYFLSLEPKRPTPRELWEARGRAQSSEGGTGVVRKSRGKNSQKATAKGKQQAQVQTPKRTSPRTRKGKVNLLSHCDGCPCVAPVLRVHQ